MRREEPKLFQAFTWQWGYDQDQIQGMLLAGPAQKSQGELIVILRSRRPLPLTEIIVYVAFRFT